MWWLISVVLICRRAEAGQLLWIWGKWAPASEHQKRQSPLERWLIHWACILLHSWVPSTHTGGLTTTCCSASGIFNTWLHWPPVLLSTCLPPTHIIKNKIYRRTKTEQAKSSRQNISGGIVLFPKTAPCYLNCTMSSLLFCFCFCIVLFFPRQSFSVLKHTEIHLPLPLRLKVCANTAWPFTFLLVWVELYYFCDCLHPPSSR